MQANKAQQDYWTSPSGLKWIEHEGALDTAMQGMLDLMLDVADPAPGHRILDIGCGTGASTIAAARRVPQGRAVGLDISAPLLDRATARATEDGVNNALFLLADAQTQALPPQGFDILVSRIGMSFFSDTVAALENLRTALVPGGRMAFLCWAATDRNPWFMIPKRAAEARLGPIPAGDPTAPGPTAFQDTGRVAALMAQAGLSDIRAEPVDVVLTPPGGAPGAARAASRVGPAARIMKAHSGTAADADAIETAVTEAFRAFETAGAVRVPAVVNLFSCRA